MYSPLADKQFAEDELLSWERIHKASSQRLKTSRSFSKCYSVIPVRSLLNLSRRLETKALVRDTLADKKQNSAICIFENLQNAINWVGNGHSTIKDNTQV